MGKLFKLELKNTYRIYGPLLLAVVIANIIALIAFGDQKIEYRILITVLSSMALGIALFILIIDFYKKDINDDRAYLTFTLPVTGKQVLLVKTLNTLMWTILSVGVCAIFVYFMICDLAMGDFGFDIFREKIIINYGFLATITITQYISDILLIYFVITLISCNKIKGKIGGFLGVIIYFVFSGIISYAETLILKIIYGNSIISNFGFNLNADSSGMDIASSSIELPFNDVSYFTVETIFTLIIIVILFLTTSYMLDKKLEV
ncbi:hypothetical protein [Clostridium grantii]|uniref:ABC-2 family transporter protein n=1 Tax=Clostridium grantii DSM 8605 TaxID=1121316 RepID=A0A1M5U4R9_9CLOT|nr:hypothetical protein [Clostridium grantii]SHH57683.1 hypothetical protein SAMN02745207_01564 [Clostridium grantii DSM 8605]